MILKCNKSLSFCIVGQPPAVLSLCSAYLGFCTDWRIQVPGGQETASHKPATTAQVHNGGLVCALVTDQDPEDKRQEAMGIV